MRRLKKAKPTQNQLKKAKKTNLELMMPREKKESDFKETKTN